MSDACQILHQNFSNRQRFSGTNHNVPIPANGLYIVFETGERAHGTDRIVHIGTHRGQGRLAKRIDEHFTPKKDRSILRRHIGRCLLTKNNDPFLKQWEIRYNAQGNLQRLEEVEQDVTEYIKKNLCFAVMSADTKKERHNLKAAILSTIAACGDCHPSQTWLGRHHPNNNFSKAREAGLWNVQNLNKKPLSEAEAAAL